MLFRALQWSFARWLVLGVVLRAGLLAWGAWQDATMLVKYTDIDYLVFSDAARAVWLGKSPYLRATYRYTPLVAWLLLPGQWLAAGDGPDAGGGAPVFGKLLFVAADVATAAIMYPLTVQAISKDSNGKVAQAELRQRAKLLVAVAWLLNPFVANISTRGNAESLLCFLCVLTVYLLEASRLVLAAVVYGAAVHMKIYPGLYVVPIVVRLISDEAARRSGSVWGAKVLSSTILFGLVSLGAFSALTGVCYWRYGHEFLEHSYLYHLTRIDHRHNFSLYFYQMYLSIGRPGLQQLVALVPFVAQLTLVIALGARFATHSLPFAMMLQTFAFVAFNKVLTSQYFLWWLCYVPMVVPLVSVSRRTFVFHLAAWVGAQATWLYFAYRLEFLAENTFRQLFGASLFLFFVHVLIVTRLIRSLRLPLAKAKKTE